MTHLAIPVKDLSLAIAALELAADQEALPAPVRTHATRALERLQQAIEDARWVASEPEPLPRKKTSLPVDEATA